MAHRQTLGYPVRSVDGTGGGHEFKAGAAKGLEARRLVHALTVGACVPISIGSDAYCTYHVEAGLTATSRRLGGCYCSGRPSWRSTLPSYWGRSVRSLRRQPSWAWCVTPVVRALPCREVDVIEEGRRLLRATHVARPSPTA